MGNATYLRRPAESEKHLYVIGRISEGEWSREIHAAEGRVDNELSRMVLEGSLNPADKVVVDLEEGKLTFGVLGETSPTGTASQIMTDE